MDMFAKATRAGLRFPTTVGLCTVEDLWNLPLTSTVSSKPNLDKIAIAINKELKDSETESFVQTHTKANDELTLKLDIVKFIIKTKMDENSEALMAKDKATKRSRLLEVLAKKQDAKIENASEEEIRVMLESL